VGAHRGWLIAAAVAIGATLLVLGLAAVLSGPRNGAEAVRVEPEPAFALPPATAGCGGMTTLPDGVEEVPLTVSTVAGQVAESVNVCINGRGPFPFVLDTGAGQSTIDAGLAHRLHLPAAGPASLFAGVGCTGTAQPVAVGAWSLDGINLASQQLSAATLPQIGGKGEPAGLLGSDVLSRFGAVRIDFTSGSLVLPGLEGPPLSVSTPSGNAAMPPVSLTAGEGTTVPLTVSTQQGNVSLNVAVRFGSGRRRSFVVDTGSSQSVVASSVARAASLQRTNLAQRQSTVCSVITVPLVRSGPWSVPGETLHPQLVGETDFGVISAGGIQGLLGSDQLKRFGWVVLDYLGARLVLG
jgi:predicted aspartyl protease